MGGAPTWRGVAVCDCLVPLLDDLAAATPTLPRITPTQGSWSTSVSASAQTHAGGGVLDISIRGWTPVQVSTLVAEARRRGLVAWHRTPAQGFTPHVHAVMDGCPHLSGRDRPVAGTAAWQVAEYRAGRNGLAGRGRDDGPREYVGSTWWTYSTPTRPEVDLRYPVRLDGTPHVYLSDGITRRWVQDAADLATTQELLRAAGLSTTVRVVQDLRPYGAVVGPTPPPE